LTRGVVLRAIGVVVAVALAGVAGWLIVTGNHDARRVQIGVLVGIWGALIGAFCLFEGRRSHQPEPAAPLPQPTSTELELRSARTQLERAEEVAARRAHEARLEQLLRAEVQAAIAREVGSLRAEIAELRGDLLEKVGNQVRLERIETTRVIGSDLEALQQEVRRLQEVTSPAFPTVQPDPAPTVRHVVEPARVRPVTRETAEVQADVQPAAAAPEPAPAAEPPALAAEPVDEPPAPRPVPPGETTGPIRIEQEASDSSRPSPVPQPERDPVVLPLASDERFDTLSGLPRIEPFTAFELDPIETEADYTGRRRRGEDPDADGRHTRGDGGGRRHRDDDGDDLLARLLARER
jgi:hypothetical protein